MILGLDAGGKTTILNKLSMKPSDVESIHDKTEPTRGFNIKQLSNSGFKLNVWDIGGQRAIRAYWRNYFNDTDILIWVIDGADEKRLAESAEEFDKISKEENLKGVPILLFVNKSDLMTTMPVSKIMAAFQDSMKGRTFKTMKCSAKDVDDTGLQDGMEWCVQQISMCKTKAAPLSTNATRSAGK